MVGVSGVNGPVGEPGVGVTVNYRSVWSVADCFARSGRRNFALGSPGGGVIVYWGWLGPGDDRSVIFSCGGDGVGVAR